MEAPAKALDLGEVDRRLANVVRPGTVAEVDLAQARARVQYATDKAGLPVLTGWLPWIAAAAGEDRAWRPPSAGEQVLLLSPYGELSAGWILAGAYLAGFPAPDASASKHVTLYRDGARIEYDTREHRLSAALPAGATMALEAPGEAVIACGDSIVTIAAGQLAVERGDSWIALDDDGISASAPAIGLDGPVEISGPLKVSGDVEFEGSAVTHSGSDVGRSHRHGGVEPGTAETETPE